MNSCFYIACILLNSLRKIKLYAKQFSNYSKCYRLHERFLSAHLFSLTLFQYCDIFHRKQLMNTSQEDCITHKFKTVLFPLINWKLDSEINSVAFDAFHVYVDCSQICCGISASKYLSNIKSVSSLTIFYYGYYSLQRISAPLQIRPHETNT